MRKEKKYRKAKRKERKGRNEQKGKQFVERKGRKMRKEEREREDFPAFWRSKFDSPKIKVGARNAIYMWTPKSWSFDKLQKV